ncbi:hypothetical protein AOLI_G00313780 [Acnodon oligacanthus]
MDRRPVRGENLGRAGATPYTANGGRHPSQAAVPCCQSARTPPHCRLPGNQDPAVSRDGAACADGEEAERCIALSLFLHPALLHPSPPFPTGLIRTG